jgi:hypothetical protein
MIGTRMVGIATRKSSSPPPPPPDATDGIGMTAIASAAAAHIVRRRFIDPAAFPCAATESHVLHALLTPTVL